LSGPYVNGNNRERSRCHVRDRPELMPGWPEILLGADFLLIASFVFRR